MECGPAKAARRLQRRKVALDRICEQESLEQLPRTAGACALVVLHGGVSSGCTHAAVDAALCEAVRPVAEAAALWHSACGEWTYVHGLTADEALAAFDLLHARPLAALPRHVLVAALVDHGTVAAIVERERASLAPVEAARIPGLQLLEDYVDDATHATLVGAIDHAAAWEVRSEGGRRVQHYGLRFDYGTVRADTSGERPPWPDWCAELAARLVADGIMATVPDQITVNDYQPPKPGRNADGIHFHVDTHSAFGPVICSLSLLAETVMRFRPAAEPGESARAALGVHLPPRSLLVLSGEARYGWEHSISARTADFHAAGVPRTRARRLSITFRSVRDAVPCTCRWAQLCDSQGAARPLRAQVARTARAGAEAEKPIGIPPAAGEGATASGSGELQLQMRALRQSDAPALTALAVEQHWDSAQADVELALALAEQDASGCSGGLGLFRDEALVSCALALRLDERTVWLSSVITQQQWRRRGHARRLVRALLARAERRADTFALFGSSFGQPLYRSLGFEPLLPVLLCERRLDSTLPAEPSSSMPDVSLLSRAELQRLIERDTPARAAAMRSWFDSAPHLALAARSSSGGKDVPLAWALCRHWLDGAVFVGPLFACGDLAEPVHAETVRSLLEAILRKAGAASRPDGGRNTRVLLLLQQPAGRDLVLGMGFAPVPGAEVQFMVRPPPGRSIEGVEGVFSEGRLPPSEVLACGYDLG